MNKIELFDALSNIKEELFDASSEVKGAFNDVVKYFASDNRILLIPRDIGHHQTSGQEGKHWEEVRARKNGYPYQVFKLSPRGIVIVEGELLPEINFFPSKIAATEYLKRINSSKDQFYVYEVESDQPIRSYIPRDYDPTRDYIGTLSMRSSSYKESSYEDSSY